MDYGDKLKKSSSAVVNATIAKEMLKVMTG